MVLILKTSSVLTLFSLCPEPQGLVSQHLLCSGEERNRSTNFLIRTEPGARQPYGGAFGKQQKLNSGRAGLE